MNGKSYTVQYFERAVFEKHPENQAPYDVLLSQLGTFRFKSKYPNGEPGAPPPTSIPATPTVATGPKLEIIDQQIRKRSFGGSEVIGYVKNTGSGDLGGIQIVATFKDGSGKIVGTDNDYGTLLRPNDIYPFKMGSSTEFASASIQLTFRAATASDRANEYRDFAASDTNVVPPANSYSDTKIVGTIRNAGSKTAYLVHISVLVTDAGGKTLDVAETYSRLNEIPPGQTAPFEVSLSVDDVPNYQVIVDSSSK